MLFEKYCYFWNQHPWMCPIAKFCEKWKCLSMGSKMPYLGFLGENFEKLLSDLKSAPSNLLNGEILWKNEYA